MHFEGIITRKQRMAAGLPCRTEEQTFLLRHRGEQSGGGDRTGQERIEERRGERRREEERGRERPA